VGLGVAVWLEGAAAGVTAAGGEAATGAAGLVGAEADELDGVGPAGETDAGLAGGLVGAGVEVATGGPSRKPTVPRPIADARA
jgi:hypothetical protein